MSQTNLTVKIRKLTETATIPTYGTEGAACFDLYADADVIIAPGETAAVPLGFSVELPEGFEMQIRPRSGITKNTKLRVANSPGCVDSDFRGEVAVLFDNIAPIIDNEDVSYAPIKLEGKAWDVVDDGPYNYESANTYLIRKGDRIAQAAVVPIPRVNFVEVDEDLTQTERGAGGFGSTGTTYEDAYGNTQCRACGSKVEGGYCSCVLRKGGR